jgi:hypothetical protein
VLDERVSVEVGFVKLSRPPGYAVVIRLASP